ncbi:hypothetical protein PFISCL1PPCAC_11570, partial [Pristionchus fissidentatus]
LGRSYRSISRYYRSISVMDPLVHATIDNWRRKSSALAANSNDVVIPVISRAFETIGTVMRHDADPRLIDRSLWSLDNERHLSMQFDSCRNEPIRDLTYDLLESVHVILAELNACRNKPPTRDYSILTQDDTRSIIEADLLNPIGGQSAYTAYEVYGLASPLDDFNYNDIYELNKHESAWGSDDIQMECAIDIGMAEQAGQSSGDGGERRHSESTAPPSDASTSHPFSMQSGKAKVKLERRNFGGGEEGMEKSSSELRCVLCDKYCTRKVGAYVSHLRSAHHKTAKELGIFFRCACGHENRSARHYRNSESCRRASVVIVRDEENEGGVEKRLGDAMKTQQPRVKQESMMDGLIEGADTTVVLEKIDRSVKRQYKEVKQEAIADRIMNYAMDRQKMDKPVKRKYKRAKLEAIGEGMMDHDENTVDGKTIYKQVTGDLKGVNQEARLMNYHDQRDVYDFEDDEEGEQGLQQDVMKKRRGVSASIVEIVCPVCSGFATRVVSTMINHIKHAHGKTPRLAGISFHCSCGHICRSHCHFTKGECPNMSVTVVRDEETSVAGEDEEEEE